MNIAQVQSFYKYLSVFHKKALQLANVNIGGVIMYDIYLLPAKSGLFPILSAMHHIVSGNLNQFYDWVLL